MLASWSHARVVGAEPPDAQVPYPTNGREPGLRTRRPVYLHHVVFSKASRARPELPVHSQASSNDSEVMPGAAATSRCRRQGGNAYGKLRGRGGRGSRTSGSGRLPRVSGPRGDFSALLGMRAVGDLAGEMAGKEEGEDCSASLGREEQGSRCCSAVRVETGGIVGALGGFGGMCLRGPARGANATGCCLNLDAWSDRGGRTPGQIFGPS